MKLRHPYYADDDSLSLLTIRTHKGDVEYKINCRSFGGIFYVKGKDLIFNEQAGNWVFPQDLVLDSETGEQVIKSGKLIRGIVSVDDFGNVVEGYYTPNPYKNCFVSSHSRTYNCISPDVLPERFYREDGARDLYHDIRGYNNTDVMHITSRKLQRGASAGQVYNIEDDKHSYEFRKDLYKKSEFPQDWDLRLGGRLLKDLTFGIELETVNGNLPNHLRNKYGVTICKDGSIKDASGAYPPEYVTVPLTGGKGLQTIRNVSGEIAKRSDIDIKCSYHLHIGNIEITRIFMVAMYALSCKIQDQIFKMFPYYKTNPNGIKEKNYCKKLPNMLNVYSDTHASPEFVAYINKSYSDIFSFLSGGLFLGRDNNRKNRTNPWPSGKWNIKSRYYWVNFVNLVFSERNTLEFRIHTPTLNGHKIINWLFICNAIARYAEKYPYKCITDKTINIEDVFNYYKTSYESKYSTIVSDNIVTYYKERCDYFRNDYRNGDNISNTELVTDKDYDFNILKVK